MYPWGFFAAGCALRSERRFFKLVGQNDVVPQHAPPTVILSGTNEIPQHSQKRFACKDFLRKGAAESQDVVFGFAEYPCPLSCRDAESPYTLSNRQENVSPTLPLCKGEMSAEPTERVVIACCKRAQQPSRLASSAPSHASRPCAWSVILRAHAKLPAHACAHTTPWCCA